MFAVRPVTGALDIARAWAFFNLHDGVIEGVSYENVKDRAWGAGAVAAGTELPVIGTFDNDIWDAGGAAADGWFKGKGSLFFGDQIVDVPAYQGLSPSGGAVLMWAQGNYDMTTGTQAAPTAIALGDGGGSTTNALLALCLDRANKRVRVQYKVVGGTVKTVNGTSTGTLTDNVDFNIAAFVDCRPSILTCSVFSDGLLRATQAIDGDIDIQSDALSYIDVGGRHLGGSISVPWEYKLRRVGWIRFPDSAVPDNVSTLVTSLNVHNSLINIARLFNAL